MMTNNNPSLNSTAESIYIYNADDIIADQCRAREETILHEKIMNDKLAKLTDENASLTNEKVSLIEENTSLINEIARLKNLLKDNGIKE